MKPGFRRFYFLLFAAAPTATMLMAQSPEIVQARARLQQLTAELLMVDTQTRALVRQAVAGRVDLSPKGQFESTREYEARMMKAEAARRRIQPEIRRRQNMRIKTVLSGINRLIARPYSAPVRIRLINYNADTGMFRFYVRTSSDTGTFKIPRRAAKNIQRRLGTLKQTGYWRLWPDGTRSLVSIKVAFQNRQYFGQIEADSKEELARYALLEPYLPDSPDSRGKTTAEQNKDMRLRKYIERSNRQFTSRITGRSGNDSRRNLPPRLKITPTFTDATGDGQLSANEDGQIVLRIRNEGRGTAVGIEILIKPDNDQMLVPASTYIGDLPSGKVETVAIPVYASPDISTGEVVMTLTINEAGGAASKPVKLVINAKAVSTAAIIAERPTLQLPETRTFSQPTFAPKTIDIEQNIPAGTIDHHDAVALIIANRNYAHPDIPDVTFAHRDGEFVRQYLIKTMRYKPENIFLYQDATLAHFQTGLRRLKNAARATADIFVYYTGHGAPNPQDKTAWFVPVDADPNYVDVSGVSLVDFYGQLREIETNHTTVVVDACFSGGSDRGMIIRNISSIYLSVELPVELGGQGVVFSSSSGEEVSSWYPEQKHSLYTYYFLKGLQGAADSDENRSLTVREMHEYLSENVPYMARRLNNRQQTPQVTPGKGDVVLVKYD